MITACCLLLRHQSYYISFSLLLIESAFMQDLQSLKLIKKRFAIIKMMKERMNLIKMMKERMILTVKSITGFKAIVRRR